jgi:YaiO family outer membrane protein
MRPSFKIAFLAATLAWMAGMAAARAEISVDPSGLGLKPPSAARSLTGTLGLRASPPGLWQSADTGDITYRGAREALRYGTRSTEYFGGVYHALSETWGASLETGMVQETTLVPRRYSLAGQLHTALAGGSGFSIGLKYRIYESDTGFRSALPPDAAGAYALVPSRLPGVSFGPSYQLQLSYQYNAANVFGFALGREVETFTQGFEVPGNSRQFTFTGQHWLTPSWALSYDLLSNDPGAVRLQGLRLGVRYRF